MENGTGRTAGPERRERHTDLQWPPGLADGLEVGVLYRTVPDSPRGAESRAGGSPVAPAAGALGSTGDFTAFLRGCKRTALLSALTWNKVTRLATFTPLPKIEKRS